MNFCKDCEFFRESRPDITYSQCALASFEGDAYPLTGLRSYDLAIETRSKSGICGPLGKLFSAKKK